MTPENVTIGQEIIFTRFSMAPLLGPERLAVDRTIPPRAQKMSNARSVSTVGLSPSWPRALPSHGASPAKQRRTLLPPKLRTTIGGQAGRIQGRSADPQDVNVQGSKILNESLRFRRDLPLESRIAASV
jgi:hypothetical protein